MLFALAISHIPTPFACAIFSSVSPALTVMDLPVPAGEVGVGVGAGVEGEEGLVAEGEEGVGAVPDLVADVMAEAEEGALEDMVASVEGVKVDAMTNDVDNSFGMVVIVVLAVSLSSARRKRWMCGCVSAVALPMKTAESAKIIVVVFIVVVWFGCGKGSG